MQQFFHMLSLSVFGDLFVKGIAMKDTFNHTRERMNSADGPTIDAAKSLPLAFQRLVSRASYIFES